MKRTQTTVTKEYDKDGKLLIETTETVEEEDEGYIYPQQVAYPVWTKAGEVTCKTEGTLDTEELRALLHRLEEK